MMARRNASTGIRCEMRVFFAGQEMRAKYSSRWNSKPPSLKER